MDREEFTDAKTGQLVEIKTPYRDIAFIPDPLPPKNWELPMSLVPLLVDARSALAKLDGIGRTLPNPSLLLSPLQQREALRSSSLEGTYATPAELLLFELNPRAPSSKTDPANDWLEVLNYKNALRNGVDYLQESRPLSRSLVRQLHEWLLAGVRGHDAEPGAFRTCQVHIGSDRRFVPPPPEHILVCLEQLESQFAAKRSLDPLVSCYLLHYQFETIHPFRDGNGRVGRLLMALMTWLWCDLRMPWLYMSAFFEREKDKYIDLLFQVSAKGAWSDWIEFCLTGTVSQAIDSIRRCESLNSLKKQMHARTTEGSGRLHAIIEALFDAPILTIPLVKDRFHVSYPTAKTDIERLMDVGIIQQLNSGPPKVFYAPQVWDIAYNDIPDVQGVSS